MTVGVGWVGGLGGGVGIRAGVGFAVAVGVGVVYTLVGDMKQAPWVANPHHRLVDSGQILFDRERHPEVRCACSTGWGWGFGRGGGGSGVGVGFAG
jgi:hypothetical protein